MGSEIRNINILVTGSSGLVGSAIQRVVRNKEYEHITIIPVSSGVCDLTNREETCAMFERIKPTHVIHLAARVGGLFKNMNEKVQMLEDNIMMNSVVLQMCHKFGVEKCVMCLSTCIFPDKTKYPIDETMLHDGPPHASNDAYAYAKRLAEVQCRAYREQYGSNFVCVIPTNVYGPCDNYSLTDGHVIPSLIHKCFNAKRDGVSFDISGTGRPLRQFIYSDDLARLILWVLEKYDETEPIILSPPEDSEVSIGDAAAHIAKAFDYEHMLNITGDGPDGQFRKTACNNKLMERIGEFAFIPFDIGVGESIRWFVNNYDVVRK